MVFASAPLASESLFAALPVGGRYRVIVENVLDPMVQSLAQGNPDFRTADLSEYAKAFLREGGMSEETIQALIGKLCVEGYCSDVPGGMP